MLQFIRTCQTIPDIQYIIPEGIGGQMDSDNNLSLNMCEPAWGVKQRDALFDWYLQINSWKATSSTGYIAIVISWPRIPWLGGVYSLSALNILNWIDCNCYLLTQNPWTHWLNYVTVRTSFTMATQNICELTDSMM